MNFPDKKYKCILADPPWEQETIGQFKKRPYRHANIPYKTMSLQEICDLPVNEIADDCCHLWLWTTNSYLHDAFHVLDSWGFKYLNTITWVKKSGIGAWFVNTTQHLLFGYNKKCVFNKEKYKPTHLITSPPAIHSQKPPHFYELIESISETPRIELFAREKRQGWDAWGDQVPKSKQMLISR